MRGVGGVALRVCAAMENDWRTDSICDKFASSSWRCRVVRNSGFSRGLVVRPMDERFALSYLLKSHLNGMQIK